MIERKQAKMAELEKSNLTVSRFILMISGRIFEGVCIIVITNVL